MPSPRANYAILVSVIVWETVYFTYPGKWSKKWEQTSAPCKQSCRTVEELVPGELQEGLKWEPDSCRLDEPDVDKCIGSAQTVFVGDSMHWSIAEQLISHADLIPSRPDTRGATPANRMADDTWIQSYRFRNSHGGVDFIWAPSVGHPGSLRHPHAQEMLRRADTVVVGMGVWDMGEDRTMRDFYHMIKTRLEFVRSVVKPTARVVVHPVTWLHSNRQVCPRDGWCFMLHHPRKVDAYRKAEQMAAGCLGSVVADTHHVIRNLLNTTTDGTVLTPHAVQIQLGIILNVVCEKLTSPVRPCAEEALLDYWSTVAEMNRVPGTSILAQQ